MLSVEDMKSVNPALLENMSSAGGAIFYAEELRLMGGELWPLWEMNVGFVT